MVTKINACWLVAMLALPVLAQPGPELLATLPDFKVELVLKADKERHGSWICVARDPQGRLLLGGQRGQPVTRVTIADGKVTKEEDLKLGISETMGMLFAFDSLYINGGGNAGGKNVYGLWRLPVQGDTFGAPQLLREWKGGPGEHGVHGMVLGPDQKIYVVCGNFVGVPEDLSPASPHRNYADDRILPRAEDGNGFGANKKGPGGFIVRMDKDGKNIEMFSAGQRNTYDIAFNPDGELFGYDSDMEWDWGTPWYRPIRVFHATSGADHGFREGSAKWPDYYADSLPATVDIGIGSPTGVGFGTGAKFPAKYQRALYVLDWSYGRISAVHLTPRGSGYVGTWENFVAPASLTNKDIKKTPLNVTDVVIGGDGALYFTIGGRSTGSALYRVSYTGKENTAPDSGHDVAGAKERALRHQVEAFHGRVDAKAIDTAEPLLASDDPFLRNAGRVAIESQPVEQWKDRALKQSNPDVALQELLALARCGGKEARDEVIQAVLKVAADSPGRRLGQLRVIQVAVARHGRPSDELSKAIVAQLNPHYPAGSFELNRELSQVLLALDAPATVEKTIKLLLAATIQEEQVSYIHDLRTISNGWTPELRKAYFSWFINKERSKQHAPATVEWFTVAGRGYGDGSSYARFLASFHKDAQKNLPPDEAKTLEPILVAYITPPPRKKPTKVRTAVIKQWKVADLEPMLASSTKGRNFERGKEVFEAAQCALCHKFGDAGGATGPDLTAVSSRFTRKDILESIIEPSKVISEQYQSTIVYLKDGDAIDGLLLEENDKRLMLQVNPLKPEKREIPKAEIDMRKPSKLSAMPPDLVNILTADEIMDLIAYLESGGKKDHAVFKN